jgi:hypothetical protein
MLSTDDIDCVSVHYTSSLFSIKCWVIKHKLKLLLITLRCRQMTLSLISVFQFILQQFASKQKPQTFSRVCLRLKRDVYRWKRNVSLLMSSVIVQWPNSVIFHVLMCFRVRFSVSKLTIL